MAKTFGSVQLHCYGGADALVYRQIPHQALAPDEVRIRVRCAPVNYTDVQIRSGAWPIHKSEPFPYVPGVEAVGTIDEVGSEAGRWSVGQPVITMMQGLGGVRAERAGSYAEYVTVKATAVATHSQRINPLDVASIGLPGVTAFHGIARLGDIAGRQVLITGAAGGVGSVATGIASALGAHVTGVVTRVEQIPYVLSRGAHEVWLTDQLQATRQPRFQGVLDVVGGAPFSACIDALADGGVFSLVGAVGGGQVTFDAWNLIRPVTLTGYSTETLTGDDLQTAVNALTGWFADGYLNAPAYRTFSVAAAGEAHKAFETERSAGRIILTT